MTADLLEISDLELIEYIKVKKELYLGVVYKKYKDYCLNFLRKDNKVLNEDELSYIFKISICLLYEKITEENFTLSSSLATFLTSICKRQYLKSYNNFIQNQKKNEITLIDNFDNISNRIHYEIEDDPNNILIHALETMENSGQDCYRLLKLFYYENYKIPDLTHEFNYLNDKSTKSQKSKCFKKLKNIVSKSINL